MMRKSSQIYIPFAFAGLIFLGATSAAMGCGFHSLDMQFGSMYSGSLSVALALRRAADTGVIDAAALSGTE